MNSTVSLALLLLIFLSSANAAAEDAALQNQSNELLMKAENADFLAGSETAAYRLHLTFTLFGLVGGEEKGEYTKDFLSREQWRERIEAPGFQEIRVRNKQKIGERMSLEFEPVRVYQLRSGIPPQAFRLDTSDVVSKIERKRVADAAAHCVEFKTVRGKEVHNSDLCVDDATGALSRSRVDDEEVEWSNFTPFRGKVYPRHFIVKEREVKVLEADVEYSDDPALTPAMFDYPSDFHTEAACQKLSAPVRIGGKDPVFPCCFIVEGRISVAATIGGDGQVKAAQVIEKAGPNTDAEALKAVKSWRFEPAKCDGNPIESRIKLNVNFHKESGLERFSR